jgi:hypothetical protein
MSQPTHEPPDPELWGRVVEICYVDDTLVYSTFTVPPPDEDDDWQVFVGEWGFAPQWEGAGPTWNDAARALIAEWEGRQ